MATPASTAPSQVRTQGHPFWFGGVVTCIDARSVPVPVPFTLYPRLYVTSCAQPTELGACHVLHASAGSAQGPTTDGRDDDDARFRICGIGQWHKYCYYIATVKSTHSQTRSGAACARGIRIRGRPMACEVYAARNWSSLLFTVVMMAWSSFFLVVAVGSINFSLICNSSSMV